MLTGTRPLVFGVKGHKLSRHEKKFFAATKPWGYILFPHNIKHAKQLRKLTDSLHKINGGAAIFVDQEGGEGARIKPPLIPQAHLPAEAYAKLYARDPAGACGSAFDAAVVMGQELKSLGFNVNCAPVLDVLQDTTHEFIRSRLFGASVEQVTALGKAMVDGLLEGGVVPVLKHIPGHGRAQADSHEALPRVAASAGDLATDFAPFANLKDTPMAMSAHILYEALDKNNLATESSVVIKETIRGTIGFDGVLVTDDLHMGALNGEMSERVQRSLDAGCDLALLCWIQTMRDPASAVDGVAPLAGDALARVARVEELMRSKKMAGFA